MLWMTNCTLTNNHAGVWGGAITNAGMLHMNNCTLKHNYAGSDGGAIYDARGGGGDGHLLLDRLIQLNQLILEESQLNPRLGELEIVGSTFDNNHAKNKGQAIYLESFYAPSTTQQATDEFEHYEGADLEDFAHANSQDLDTAAHDFISTTIASSTFISGAATVVSIALTQPFITTTRLITGNDIMIVTNGLPIDFGVCAPGFSPGAAGDDVLVRDGDFTGCYAQCPPGTFQPGGMNTSALRTLEHVVYAGQRKSEDSDDVYEDVYDVLGEFVGCLDCPGGTVCPHTATAVPQPCAAGHYNPTVGSREATCRLCESGKHQPAEGATACLQDPNSNTLLYGTLLIIGSFLCVCAVVCFLYRRRLHRLEATAANLRLSRDRAQFDVSLLSHQAAKAAKASKWRLKASSCNGSDVARFMEGRHAGPFSASSVHSVEAYTEYTDGPVSLPPAPPSSAGETSTNRLSSRDIIDGPSAGETSASRLSTVGGGTQGLNIEMAEQVDLDVLGADDLAEVRTRTPAPAPTPELEPEPQPQPQP